MYTDRLGDGKLTVTYRQPIDVSVDAAQRDSSQQRANAGKGFDLNGGAGGGT